MAPVWIASIMHLICRPDCKVTWRPKLHSFWIRHFAGPGTARVGFEKCVGECYLIKLCKCVLDLRPESLRIPESFSVYQRSFYATIPCLEGRPSLVNGNYCCGKVRFWTVNAWRWLEGVRLATKLEVVSEYNPGPLLCPICYAMDHCRPSWREEYDISRFVDRKCVIKHSKIPGHPNIMFRKHLH